MCVAYTCACVCVCVLCLCVRARARAYACVHTDLFRHILSEHGRERELHGGYWNGYVFDAALHNFRCDSILDQHALARPHSSCGRFYNRFVFTKT